MVETKPKVKLSSWLALVSTVHCPKRFISILFCGVSILTSVLCSSELPPKPSDKDDLKTVASGVGKTERMFCQYIVYVQYEETLGMCINQ